MIGFLFWFTLGFLSARLVVRMFMRRHNILARLRRLPQYRAVIDRGSYSKYFEWHIEQRTWIQNDTIRRVLGHHYGPWKMVGRPYGGIDHLSTARSRARSDMRIRRRNDRMESFPEGKTRGFNKTRWYVK